MWCASKFLFASIERKHPVPDFSAVFPERRFSFQPTGLVTCNGVYGMSEGKEYICIDMIFAFLCK